MKPIINEFPLGVVADTERRLKQLSHSFVEAEVVSYVTDSGLGYDCKPAQRLAALPAIGIREIKQLFADVRRMGDWIREHHS